MNVLHPNAANDPIKKKKMGIQQKLLLVRVNKRIDRVVSQYLKVLQSSDVDANRDEYTKFVSDIRRARLASSSDESGGGGVYNDESLLLFAKQLCLPVQECKFLERMGTRLVLASISKESGDALLTYLRGLHDMCREYTNKYHCSERSIEKAMSICDDVLNGVRQDDRSMLSTIFSGVVEKLRGCSSADSVVDEMLSLLPSTILRDLQSTCGLGRDGLRSEILRIHRCITRKDTSTKLRKHAHAVVNILSRILNQGKTKPLLAKATGMLSILLRSKKIVVPSSATAAPSCVVVPSDVERACSGGGGGEQQSLSTAPLECSAEEDKKHAKKSGKNKREHTAVPAPKTRSKPKLRKTKAQTVDTTTTTATATATATATDTITVAPKSPPGASVSSSSNDAALTQTADASTINKEEATPPAVDDGAGVTDPDTFSSTPEKEEKSKSGARRSRRKIESSKLN
jgi:hypothetical protein